MSEAITRKIRTTANTAEHGKVQGDLTLTIDFEGVTREELMEMARSKLTIDFQNWVRQAAKKQGKEALQAFDNYELSVRDHLDAATPRRSKAEKLAEALGINVESAQYMLQNPEAVEAAVRANQE